MSRQALTMTLMMSVGIALLPLNPSWAQQTGQALYQANCAGCHGLDGRGGEHAPDIATVQRVQQFTGAELIRTIRDGVPGAGMPAFGSRLNGQQLSSLADYVRSLQGERKTARLPGSPESGHTIFQKAACSECHMAGGEGGYIAGDLSSYAAAHSIEQIREAILNPNGTFDPRHSLATVTLRNEEQYTGVIRNEDNFSLQLQSRDGAFRLLDKSTVTNIARGEKSPMPDDYKTRLSPSDLSDLISYLIQLAAGQPTQAQDTSEW